LDASVPWIIRIRRPTERGFKSKAGHHVFY
jgi:hypothetical protein